MILICSLKYLWSLAIYWQASAFPAREQVKRMDYEAVMISGVGPEQGKQYSEGRK